VKYDWAGFWSKRLTSTSADAPTGGIEASGWKLSFSPEPPVSGRASRRISDTTFTIGLELSRDGTIRDAIYGGPAFQAGLGPGMKIAAVNGRVFTPEVFDDALKTAKNSSRAIELLIIVDDYYKTFSIDFHGDERNPHLVRIPDKPDFLEELLKPEAR
jgi:predicted metalloprotease with PDZ domain